MCLIPPNNSNFGSIFPKLHELRTSNTPSFDKRMKLKIYCKFSKHGISMKISENKCVATSNTTHKTLLSVIVALSVLSEI